LPTRRFPASAGPLLRLGKGARLHAAWLGTVSLHPSPPSLPQAGDPRRPQLPDLHKLGMRRMNGPIVAFAQTIEALGATPASAL